MTHGFIGNTWSVSQRSSAESEARSLIQVVTKRDASMVSDGRPRETNVSRSENILVQYHFQ